MKCPHHWEIDRTNKGTCIHCGEQRQFPWGGKGEVVVLKEGRKLGQIPSKFTSEEKQQIIEETDVRGVPAVTEARGIPTSTLYSWRTRRNRARLRTQLAVASISENDGLPHDLWLRRDGDVVQLYCQGKLWAAFSTSDSLQRDLTHRAIVELVERYLRDGTLAKGGHDG